MTSQCRNATAYAEAVQAAHQPDAASYTTATPQAHNDARNASQQPHAHAKPGQAAANAASAGHSANAKPTIRTTRPPHDASAQAVRGVAMAAVSRSPRRTPRQLAIRSPASTAAAAVRSSPSA